MRNVDRLEEPAVLKQNAPCWTRQLLDAITRTRRENVEVSPALSNRYKDTEVKEGLNSMYSGLCCYCESHIGDVAFENIEHRKPKSLFPELTFSWDNLHLACPQCNTAKSNKWDSTHEILDAVNDIPISNHLGYQVVSTEVTRKPITNRGAITIEHAKLNRPGLLDTRLRVFFSAYKAIKTIRDKERAEENTPMVRIARRELRRRFSEEHGSVIEFVANDMLNNIS